jgi:hypothetical protein
MRNTSGISKGIYQRDNTEFELVSVRQIGALP